MNSTAEATESNLIQAVKKGEFLLIFSSTVCAFLFPFIRNWQITDPIQRTLLPALVYLNRMLWTQKHSLWHRKMFPLLFKYQNDCWSEQCNPITLTGCTDRVSLWRSVRFFLRNHFITKVAWIECELLHLFQGSKTKGEEGGEWSQQHCLSKARYMNGPCRPLASACCSWQGPTGVRAPASCPATLLSSLLGAALPFRKKSDFWGLNCRRKAKI